MKIESFIDTTIIENAKQFEYVYENFEEPNELFNEFFIYSPDSLCYLDLDSYSLILKKANDNSLIVSGTDVDSEVGLVKIKEKQKLRIHFCGTVCWVEEAEWTDNENIKLFGFSKITEIEVPTIWTYNLKTKEKKSIQAKIIVKNAPGSYLKNVRMKGIEFED